MVKHLLLLASFILVFSFCFTFLSFDFIEASFIDNIDINVTGSVEDMKYNSDNKYIYLSLSSPFDNSVFVFDTLSNEIINRITDVGKKPSDIDYNPDNKFIYVTNRVDNSVSVINSTSNQVIKNITGVGNDPKAIIYNPENHLIYVTNVDDNSVSVINSSSNEVIKNITEIGNSPSAITYNPKDRTIYVAGLNFISIINSSNLISKSITNVGNAIPILQSYILYNPFNNNIYTSDAGSDLVLIFNSINNTTYIPMKSAGVMEYDPDNNLIYIANHFGITIINSTMKSTIHQMLYEDSYWDLAYNPEDDLIYATAPLNGFISVINSSNKLSSQDKILSAFDFPKMTIHDHEFKPSDIAYNPNNKLLYIINHERIHSTPNHERETIIFIINSSSNEVIKNITGVGKNPADIAYNPNNNLIYITNLQNDSSVSVINSSSNEVIKNITGVGEKPNGIVYNPDNKLIYVTNFDEGSISVINSSSNIVIKNITGVGKNPADIAYNLNNKHLYILNQDIFNYITVINPINGDIIEKASIGVNANHILYNPSNHKMYITKTDRQGIIVMNTAKDR